MRNDQKYLEIINRNDQVEMIAFTAGYMAAMEVNHQYCPVQDSDFSSHILQSCVIERILAEIKMDEQQRRNMGKMILNHFGKSEWTDHPEINCEDVKVDDSGNEVDGETSPKQDPRFHETLDGRSIDMHDKPAQVVADIAVKAIGTMLQGFAKAYDHSASNIAMSIDDYDVDKTKLRGMIYDAERVDDYGNEVDAAGIPVPPESHRPWPFYGYRNRITREFTSREDYDKLDIQERIRYYKVRYLEVLLDGKVKTLYEDSDVQLINDLFEALVQVGDPAEQVLCQKDGTTEADNQTEGCTHDCMCKGDVFNNKQTCGACAQCQCGDEGSVDDKGIATL